MECFFSQYSPFLLFLPCSRCSRQYFSAVQYKHEEWSKSLRCQKQGTRRTCVEDEMRRSGGRTETSIKHSSRWSLYPSGMPADFWAYLEDHRCTVAPPALLPLLALVMSKVRGLFNEGFIKKICFIALWLVRGVPPILLCSVKLSLQNKNSENWWW